jgi:hypothetical protein
MPANAGERRARALPAAPAAVAAASLIPSPLASADDFWLDSAAGAGMSWELGPGAEELVGAHEELGLDLDLGSFLPMEAEAEEALISAGSNASDSPASSMWLSAEQVAPEVRSGWCLQPPGHPTALCPGCRAPSESY